jgi:hypothetical protein
MLIHFEQRRQLILEVGAVQNAYSSPGNATLLVEMLAAATPRHSSDLKSVDTILFILFGSFLLLAPRLVQ